MPTLTDTIGPGNKNRFIKTEKFDDTGAWGAISGGTVTADNTIAPDGTTTADLLNDTASGTLFKRSQTITSGFLTPKIVYSASVHLKNSTSGQSELVLTMGSFVLRASITWSGANITGFTKTVTGSPTYAEIRRRVSTQGFTRFTLSMVIPAAGSSAIFDILPASVNGSATQTGAVFAWGAQFEQAPYATIYSSVDTASDPTYKTVDDWLTATVGDTTNIRVGLLMAGTHFVNGSSLFPARTNTTPTVYRHLKGNTLFNPYTNVGPKLVVRWGSGSNDYGIRSNEDYFRISDIGLYGDQSRRNVSGNKRLLWLESQNCKLSRVFFCDPNGGGFSGSDSHVGVYINGTSGVDLSLGHEFYDCFWVGGGKIRGMVAGVEYGANATGCTFSGCVGYNISNFGIISAFTTVPNGPIVRNSIFVDCGNSLSGLFNSVTYGISSDVVTLDPTWRNLVSASALWLNPTAKDFRTRENSPARNIGTNLSTVYIAAIGSDADYANEDRPNNGSASQWNIGPYQLAYPPSNISSPTTVITSIGGSSRQCFSLIEWLSDIVPASLYSANQIHIAELYDDADFIEPQTIRIEYFDVVTTSTQYLIVRPATGHRYVPHDHTGITIKYDSLFPEVSNRSVIWNTARFTQISGIFLENTADSGVSDRNPRCLEVFTTDAKIDSVHALLGGSTTVQSAQCIEIDGENIDLVNSTSRGSGTVGTGASRGITIGRASKNCNILHCNNYKITGNNSSSVWGISVAIDCKLCRISGCHSFATAGNGPKDFNDSTVEAVAIDHCTSSDTTAVGEAAVISASISAIFRDAPNDDYRLLGSSSSVNSGDSLKSYFTTDAVGNTRFSPYDRGIYEGIFYAELLATPKPSSSYNWVKAIEIQRLTGETLFFTDSSEPLLHAGQTYLTDGGIRTSARRIESGFRESNFEISGVISSKIQAEQIAGGLYRGAKVVVRIVDWRFPWTLPKDVWVYEVVEIKFDSRKWTAQLVVAELAKLEQKVGDLNLVGCEFDLGSRECGVDIRALSEIGKSVTTVNGSMLRREFTCSGISGSRPDDFFGRGKLMWLSHGNKGLVSQVKSYIASTKTIRLEHPTYVDIAAGHSFTLEPGCRKRFLLDCIPKFNNGPRYGGDPFATSTDAVLDTPTR